jgi:hypothetical protein
MTRSNVSGMCRCPPSASRRRPPPAWRRSAPAGDKAVAPAARARPIPFRGRGCELPRTGIGAWRRDKGRQTSAPAPHRVVRVRSPALAHPPRRRLLRHRGRPPGKNCSPPAGTGSATWSTARARSRSPAAPLRAMAGSAHGERRRYQVSARKTSSNPAAGLPVCARSCDSVPIPQTRPSASSTKRSQTRAASPNW